MVAINFLKLHMFLFYASFTCVIIYLTVYVRTYTDANYHEVGLLMMICALSGVFGKPFICSLADRHRAYKGCLLINLLVMTACTLPMALLPFFYQRLLEAQVSPRLIWYLALPIALLYFTALGTVITLDDVFIVHRCQHSLTGEDIGEYRYLGSLGPACSSLTVACLGHYIDLPYLSLPMLASLLLSSIDIFVVTRLKNLEADEQRPLGGCQAQTNGNEKQELELAAPSPSVTSKGSQEGALSAGAAARGSRVSVAEQLGLLRQLNRYDNYNLCKYLAALVLFGAFAQVHYVFFLAMLTETLKQRRLVSLFFGLSALIQIACGAGETSSLLWFNRWAMGAIGRDAILMLFLALSGARYAVYGFLMDQLNVWLVALLDFQTGFLWGLLYNLMVDTAASYLAILDRLLVSRGQSSASAPSFRRELAFLEHLEKLKGRHSIHSIRFALRATLQSLFSGACEGLGFALGPLLAGLWLGAHTSSPMTSLYQAMAFVHIGALATMLLLEYGLIRSLLKAPSHTNAVQTLVAATL